MGFLRQRIQEFNACIPYAGRLWLSSVLRAWQQKGLAAIMLLPEGRKGGPLYQGRLLTFHSTCWGSQGKFSV